MLEELKSVQGLVRKVLEEQPKTRDSDTLLVLMVWKEQGVYLSPATIQGILDLASPPESIRRVRQKIQEGGEFVGTVRHKRLAEEPPVRDWTQGLL